MVERVGRLFLAAPLPSEARLALAARLDGADVPGKVVAPENWHLTLRFLGSVDEPAYDRFLAAMDQAEPGPPFRLRLGGIGAFPRLKRATVVWVGVSAGAERLGRIAQLAEEAAQTAGLPGEERPFHPHLTLSRVRPQANVSRLAERFRDLGVGWTCESVILYRSHLGRGGARYEPLETFPLIR